MGQRAPYGRKFMHILSSPIATTIPTPPGRKFDLIYSTRPQPGVDPVGYIYMDGRRAQVVDGSIRWRRNTPIRFETSKPETLLEFSYVWGRPAMSLDQIELRDAAAVKYYFPRNPSNTSRVNQLLGTGPWKSMIRDLVEQRRQSPSSRTGSYPESGQYQCRQRPYGMASVSPALLNRRGKVFRGGCSENRQYGNQLAHRNRRSQNVVR